MKNHNAFFKNCLYRSTLGIVLSAALLAGCDNNDPVKEDTPELITMATLTFTPAGGGDAVVVTATDPDGEGIQNIGVDDDIHLEVSKTYTLKITLVNGLADPSSAAYDITAEVEEESDEHMFFFEWTNNVFSDPAGNGNVDNRQDDLRYDDEDANGLPVGLETSWTAASNIESGKFRVLLKHQPELKSANADASMGESDLDVEFIIDIE